MARKRRRTKNSKNKHSSIKSMIRKVVNQGAAPLAFWQQLSEKDYKEGLARMRIELINTKDYMYPAGMRLYNTAP